jgi:transposase-like protein
MWHDLSLMLAANERRTWGVNAVIQRCQIHKRRNVEGHVPEKYHAELGRRLSDAYDQTAYATAKSLAGSASLN